MSAGNAHLAEANTPRAFPVADKDARTSAGDSGSKDFFRHRVVCGTAHGNTPLVDQRQQGTNPLELSLRSKPTVPRVEFAAQEPRNPLSLGFFCIHLGQSGTSLPPGLYMLDCDGVPVDGSCAWSSRPDAGLRISHGYHLRGTSKQKCGFELTHAARNNECMKRLGYTLLLRGSSATEQGSGADSGRGKKLT
ncbi:hypothetical protein BP6252_01940 [Coleophoma cylindrospora]|uniref:Uncharacterized protein n=1 Tax=Coleophoma cylindrospora TaxID=1849047 RepID=A0A3D8SDD2_9HELO|nr:hypothetical protein BP6252_01940 [Coleophoma cylindrospora]